MNIRTEILNSEAARYLGMASDMQCIDQAVIICIVCLTVVSMCVAIFFIIVCYQLRRQNKALEKKMQAMCPVGRKAVPDPQAESYREAYQNILRTVYQERLYADQQMDRDTFAARMNISRHTLNRILLTNTNGQSFPQWLNSIRIEKASELLLNEPDKPVSLVANEVGLSPNNFHRLFRLRYGVTPNEYRQNEIS